MSNYIADCARTLLVGVALSILTAYGVTVEAANDDSSDRGQAATEELVDCVLPGKVRKMGGDMSYMEPQRQVKTTAKECEQRGGKVSAEPNQEPTGK